MFSARIVLAILLCVLVPSGGCEPGIPEAAKRWVDDWAAVVERTPGFVVWESYRSGRWRIWYRDLDGSGLRRLTTAEDERDHFAPHVSPDGRYVAYLSLRSDTNAYRQSKGAKPVLRLHRIDDGRDTALVEGARSYYEDRAVVWLDSRRLLYIASDGTTRRIDIETRKQKVVQRKKQRKYGYLLDPTLRHATTGRPSFARYNEKARRVLGAKIRKGCQPYFSRDGRFGFWVAKPGGPIRRVDLRTSETADIVLRDDPSLPTPFDYVYFPMVSAGQRLLAFGASRDEHDHFRADYEIFVVPIDPEILMPIGPPVRYSFDPATDRFPDVFEAGAELGRHWGEAPFRISLRATDNGPWEWDFGDGTQKRSKRGRHLYQEPGLYRIVARRTGRHPRGRGARGAGRASAAAAGDRRLRPRRGTRPVRRAGGNRRGELPFRAPGRARPGPTRARQPDPGGARFEANRRARPPGDRRRAGHGAHSPPLGARAAARSSPTTGPAGAARCS